TEFSSYLVVEPGMNRRLSGNAALQSDVTTGAGSSVNRAPSAAPAPERFEAAKAASAQRAATSMAAADAAVGMRDDAGVRRAGNVTFILSDSVWTHVRYKKTGQVLRIKPFSDA